MIISLGRNYIFAHAPKTAGTAMALALEARAMKDDIMLGDTPKALNRRRRLKDAQSAGRLWKHATLADIDGLISQDQLNGLFAFTLVRNPWDRMVSYYHWLQSQQFDHPAVSLAKQLSFHDFAQSALICSSMKASPARHYVTDATGQERCDLYIRIEDFAKDAQPLFDHLGFELTLDRINTSDRARRFQDYYNPESRESVAQACSEDIARFGYRFDT